MIISPSLVRKFVGDSVFADGDSPESVLTSICCRILNFSSYPAVKFKFTSSIANCLAASRIRASEIEIFNNFISTKDGRITFSTSISML